MTWSISFINSVKYLTIIQLINHVMLDTYSAGLMRRIDRNRKQRIQVSYQRYPWNTESKYIVIIMVMVIFVILAECTKRKIRRILLSLSCCHDNTLHTVWKLLKFALNFLDKNYVKITYLLVNKNAIVFTKYFQMKVNILFFHTATSRDIYSNLLGNFYIH